jgi:hypothetical protein
LVFIFLILEPEPELQLVPNCDDSCVESVKTDKITQSNHECCDANGFTRAHGCYGLDSRHAGAAVCFKKKGKRHNTTVGYKLKVTPHRCAAWFHVTSSTALLSRNVAWSTRHLVDPSLSRNVT